jgi:hypothetical protein
MFSFKLRIIVIFIVFCSEVSGVSNKISKTLFLEDLFILKQRYINQSDRFWSNIESTFLSSIYEFGTPSVVLFVFDNETSVVAANVFKEIQNLFSKHCSNTGSKFFEENLTVDPYNDNILSGYINGNKFDDSKKYVDLKLEQIFSNGNKFTFVHNIEKLPPTTMLLFYTYGDDFYNSKYKGIIIFMTLKLNIVIENSQRQLMFDKYAELSEFFENYLFDLYSPIIPEDQLRPLFTRIGNNLILINYENDNFSEDFDFVNFPLLRKNYFYLPFIVFFLLGQFKLSSKLGFIIFFLPFSSIMIFFFVTFYKLS